MYFQTKPLIHLKNIREEKKIFLMEADNEKWKDTMNEIKEKLSKYNLKESLTCFLITSDNKLLICNRTQDFYISFISMAINNKLLMKKILNCIQNLEISDFVSLLTVLNYKYNIKSKFLKFILEKDYNNLMLFENIDTIKFLSKCNFNNLFYNYQNELFDILEKKILYFLNLKHIPKSNITYILPGGKKEKNESDYETIVREIKEEVKLNINNDTLFLNSDFQFKSFTPYSNINPILYMSTFDYVLNYYFFDKIYILYLSESSNNLKNQFKENHEIKFISFFDLNLQTIILKHDNQNDIKNYNKKLLFAILHKYIEFIKN